MKSDVRKTCISDHHKMIFSVLGKIFAKGKPKAVFYRYYKKHDQNSFNKKLQDKISQPELSFEKSIKIFQSRLMPLFPVNKKRSGITTILSLENVLEKKP